MGRFPRLLDARCAHEFLSLAISREPKPCEAEQHHRPGRRLGNFADDDREALVGSAPPRPFVGARRYAEAAECLAVVGRGVREGAVGDIALWYDEPVD
jgi:hypothetical protein